jgi:hypothetical protein
MFMATEVIEYICSGTKFFQEYSESEFRMPKDYLHFLKNRNFGNRVQAEMFLKLS